MNIRKLASIGLAIATVVVTVTGILLYFGIGDHYLMVLAHDVFSITFILFVVIHMLLNIKPFMAYLSARKETTGNIVIAVLFVGIIAYSFSNRPQLSYSDYPAVESIDIRAVLAADGVTYDEATALLQEQGLIVPEGESLTIRDFSSANKMNPKVIYGTMTANKPVAEE